MCSHVRIRWDSQCSQTADSLLVPTATAQAKLTLDI